MAEINEKEFVDELLFCIKEFDIIKVQALLQYFPSIKPYTQNSVLYEISQVQGKIFFLMIEFIMQQDIKDPDVREKIFQVILNEAYRNNEFINKLIKTGSSHNRLILLSVIKEMEYIGAMDDLVWLLSKENDPIILSEILKVISFFKDDNALPLFSEFALSENIILATTTVSCLASYKNYKALELLHGILNIRNLKSEISDHINKSIEEIEQKLKKHSLSKSDQSKNQEIENANRLITSLSTGDFHTTYAAIKKYSTEDRVSTSTLFDMLKSVETSLVIHLLRILHNRKSDLLSKSVHRILYQSSVQDSLKLFVYNLIGKNQGFESVINLVESLTDKCELIRLAAARALNCNLSDIALAGIRNKIETTGNIPTVITSAIIDSKSDQIFNKLLKSDTFIELATYHISEKSTPDIYKHYTNMFEIKGLRYVLRLIRERSFSSLKSTGKTAFIIHSSKSISCWTSLVLYRMGIKTHVYKTASEALLGLRYQIPDYFISDLYLSEFDGVKLLYLLNKLLKHKPKFIFQTTTSGENIHLNRDEYLLQLPDHDHYILKVLNDATVSDKPVANEIVADHLKELIASSPPALHSSLLNLFSESGVDLSRYLKAFLFENDNRLNLYALKLIKHLKKDELSNEIIKKINSKPDITACRFQYYDTLRTLNIDTTVFSLSDILKEKDYPTLLAGVSLLDNHLSDLSHDIIKNLLDSGEIEMKFFVSIIIDSYSTETFKKHIKKDYFTYAAIHHLAHEVHQETRDYYIDILASDGHKDLVDDIFKEVVNRVQNEDFTLFVINESNIKRSVLTRYLDSDKYIILPFDNWNKALDMMSYIEPDFILTDLYSGLNSSLTFLNELSNLNHEKVPSVIILSDFHDQLLHDNTSYDCVIKYEIVNTLSYPLDIDKLKKFIENRVS